jgi:hypothetical protein
MTATQWRNRVAAAGILAAVTAPAFAQQAPAASTLLGVNCNAPPAMHCPDTECLGVMVVNPGRTVEPKSRRTFFFDCPAGYKPGDDVTFVLSLHGGGSYANWQRNYFPIMDHKDKYKLVIATPSSPYQAWDAGDDAYLQGIVDLVVGTVGKENVTAFWLAGHSQGGATSSRIICTDYFKDKVDVRISLSGGRTGSPGRAPGAGGPPGAAAPAAGAAAPQAPATPPAPAALPTCDFSNIFTQGEHEARPAEFEKSTWAQKYGCTGRVKRANVADTKQGYVWDSTRQNPGSESWGRYPKPGEAELFEYTGCKDGRVVADVIRLKKGHTEGLEPNVVDQIAKLAASAKGGKIKNGSWTPPAPPPPRTLGNAQGTTAAPRPGAAPATAPAPRN